MKRILITGANYTNKGAQSMLFTTISELKKRNEDVEFYFATFEKNRLFDELNSDIVYYHFDSVDIALERKRLTPEFILKVAKNILKKVGKYPNIVSPSKLSDLKNLLPSIDLIVDLSGFGIGDSWGLRDSEYYLDKIRLAEKFNIPIILMPQSFGPFETLSENTKFMDEAKRLLQIPELIFVREESGFEILKNLFGLNNIQLSPDLVLQSKNIEFGKVFLKQQRRKLPEINYKNAVAVVPNAQCLKQGDESQAMAIYKKTIEKLQNLNKNVYLIAHSYEDLPICKSLHDYFADTNVTLIDLDLSCIEFDELISNFTYNVCSRYHSIIHSYKNYVPCLILGWADKYNELATLVGQPGFVFDLKSKEFEWNDFEKAIEDMNETYDLQKNIIENSVKKIQSNNVFDLVSRYL